MAKDLSESLFDAVKALIDADTGAGGLLNSTGSQYVRKVIQKDNANYDGRVDVYPSLVIDILPESENSAFGSSATSDRATCIVKIEVVSKRDPGRAVQNAVNDRMRTVLSRVAPSGTDWAFTKLSRVRGYQGRASGTELRYVHEYAVRGRSGSTADVAGISASVTLTATNDTSGVTFTGEVVESTLRRQFQGVQRARDISERWSPDAYSGTVTIRGVLSSAATELPPRPSGEVATVTLTAFGSTARSYAGVVEDAVYDARAGAEPQAVLWRVRIGLFGDTNTDTGTESVATA